jgi:hypothetical protein
VQRREGRRDDQHVLLLQGNARLPATRRPDAFVAGTFADRETLGSIPAKVARLRQTTIERFVKAHRLRRWQAPEVLRILKQPLSVAPGVVEAASDHIRTLTVRIRLVNQQLKAAHRKLDELCAQLIPSEENEPGQRCEPMTVGGLPATLVCRPECYGPPLRDGCCWRSSESSPSDSGAGWRKRDAATSPRIVAPPRRPRQSQRGQDLDVVALLRRRDLLAF